MNIASKYLLVAALLVLPIAASAQGFHNDNFLAQTSSALQEIANQLNAIFERLQELLRQSKETAPASQPPVQLPSGSGFRGPIGLPAATSPAADFCYEFGGNLSVGASGADVVALHKALQAEGFSIDSRETSVQRFGDSTADAITGFQQKYANSVLAPWGLRFGTGYLGRTTRAKLNELFKCGRETISIPPTQTGIQPTPAPAPRTDGETVKVTVIGAGESCNVTVGLSASVLNGPQASISGSSVYWVKAGVALVTGAGSNVYLVEPGASVRSNGGSNTVYIKNGGLFNGGGGGSNIIYAESGALVSNPGGNVNRCSSLQFVTSGVLSVDVDPPSVPTGLVATAISSTQIDLSWAASSDNSRVNSYKVYRCTGSLCAPNTVVSGPFSNFAVNVTGVYPSTTYTYAVSVLDDSGNESAKSASVVVTTPPASIQDSQIPTAPSNLRLLTTPTVTFGQTSFTVNVSWNDNSANETSFELYKRASGGLWSFVARLNANITSYGNTGLSAGTYEYKVRACNASGCSSDSNIAPITVGQQEQTAPLTVSVDTSFVGKKVVFGEKGEVLGRFVLTAGPNEDVIVTHMNIVDSMNTALSSSPFKNLTLWNGPTQISAAVSTSFVYNTYIASACGSLNTPSFCHGFSFSSFPWQPLRIPKGTSVTLTLKGDVVSQSELPSAQNTEHRFGFTVKDSATVSAHGATTGAIFLAEGNFPLLSNAFTIVDSAQTTFEVSSLVRKDILVPRGVTANGAQQSVAHFVLKNNAVDIFGDDVRISKIALKLDLNSGASNLALRNIRLQYWTPFGWKWWGNTTAIAGAQDGEVVIFSGDSIVLTNYEIGVSVYAEVLPASVNGTYKSVVSVAEIGGTAKKTGSFNAAGAPVPRQDLIIVQFL